MFGERRAQALEVAHAKRHRPSPSDAAGGVGEADKALTLVRLQQLDDGREPFSPARWGKVNCSSVRAAPQGVAVVLVRTREFVAMEGNVAPRL